MKSLRAREEEKEEKSSKSNRGLVLGILVGVSALGVAALAMLGGRTQKAKWLRVQNNTLQPGLTYRLSGQNSPEAELFRRWTQMLQSTGDGTFLFFNEGALPADWPEEDVRKANRLRTEFTFPEKVSAITIPPISDVTVWVRQ